jgi:Spy/CpxP family protein refolding chaperone
MTRSSVAFILVLGFITALAVAQAAPPAGGAGKGGQPGAGQAGAGPGNPAQFQQQMLDMIKEKLEATDEEWSALSPKIDKVMEAQRNARTGAGMTVTRNSANGQSARSTGGGNVNTPPGKAMQEVRTTLDDKDASPEEITRKLAAMREARDKARADLADTQKALKEKLTPRQEAVLVTLGILD